MNKTKQKHCIIIRLLQPKQAHGAAAPFLWNKQRKTLVRRVPTLACTALIMFYLKIYK